MTEASLPAPDPQTEPAQTSRRRMLLRAAVFGVVAIGAAVFILPAVPRAQHVRLHLGSGSSQLTKASARVGRAGAWDRVTSWRFDHGAPPSISWEFELPNGAREIEVELTTASDSVTRKVSVDLEGGETNVELQEAMRGLP
jgi:hypothetical protein